MKNIWATQSLAIVLLLLTSCTNGTTPGGQDGEDASRKAWLYAWDLTSDPAGGLGQSLTGSAPFTAGFLLDAQYGDNDAGRIEDVVRKFELDFGDGSGWVDVSAEALSWDRSFSDGVSAERLSQHIYMAPGTYHVKGRITYWDGAIYSTGADSNAKVVVTSVIPE